MLGEAQVEGLRGKMGGVAAPFSLARSKVLHPQGEAPLRKEPQLALPRVPW